MALDSPVEQTRDLPPLFLRAAFRPGSVDAEKRTAEICWTTGARVLRGWFDKYYEELSLDPKHVRMQRLNNGAPLLNSHNGYDVRSVLGVVESAKLEGKQGTAIVRFAKAEDDPEADAVFRKVKDGILQNISVGYRIFRMETTESADDKIPVRRATDWEPYEISVVPMGADDGAGFRSSEHRAPNACVFIDHEERSMDPKNPAAPAPPVTAAAPTPAPAGDEAARAAEVARQEGARVERERASNVRGLALRHKLPEAFANKLVADGKTVDEARTLILEELAKRSEAPTTEGHIRIELGDDVGRTAMREGIRNALLHRVAPNLFKLEEVGRQYRNMTLLDLSRECLDAVGQKTRGLSVMQTAGFALGLRDGGQHSTSDFPILLADVANKTLRKAYDEAPQTFQAISTRTTLPDFKPVKRNQLGDAPQLVKVAEGGEFTRGTIGEGKEQYQLLTYGKVFAITRQALINDDLAAFSRIPALFGRSARDLESDIVWAQITANAAMGDGDALFHANHGNLAGAGAAISVATVGAGRAAMRKQKGLGKKQFVNVQAKYLVVPAALETVADQLVSTALLANATGSVNPFAGRLQVVAEPRLDADSLISWYLAADPGQIDIVEYAYLQGEDGPALETRIGFDVDGMEVKCRHDFAAKVIDHRGLYKNPGA